MFKSLFIQNVIVLQIPYIRRDLKGGVVGACEVVRRFPTGRDLKGTVGSLN